MSGLSGRRFPTIEQMARRVQRQLQPKLIRTTQISSTPRTFQDTPDVGRRLHPRGAPFTGETDLEARAAQDVPLTLPMRIVLKALRERGEQFEFQNTYGGQLNIGGLAIDFLITSRAPQLVLDVYTNFNRPPLDWPGHSELKKAQLEASGYRYAFIWDTDIYESRERLEGLLDDILGISNWVTVTEPSMAIHGTAPPIRIDNGVDPGQDQGALISPDVLSEVARLTQMSVEELLQFITNHHQQHELVGSDPITQARSAGQVTLVMKNNSGARVQRGTPIKLDTSITNAVAFTVSATQDDTRVSGVVLEDITDGGYGNVCISGDVQHVRVASGTTMYQFLRQSSTSGVAEGTADVTDGTFAMALSSRDATWGTVRAVVARFARGAVPLSGLSLYGDGSDGDVTISGTTTLTTTKYYNNLTVNSTLNNGGYGIFVAGTLSGTGTIANNASAAGGNGGAASGAPPPTTPGTAGSAGTSGATGTLGAPPAGVAGGVGGGVPGAGASSTGSAVTNSIGGSAGAGAGTGGASGNPAGNGTGAGAGGGADGTGATGGNSTGGTRTATTGIFRTLTGVSLFKATSSTGVTAVTGSGGAAGGGGGAGGGGAGGAAGGGGGGGGGNGGFVLIIARYVAGSWIATANGTNGGNGGAGGAASGVGGGGGGGGGGNGGSGGIVILLFQQNTSWTGSLAANGGTGGVKGGGGSGAGGFGNGGTGQDGATGAAGVTIQFQDAA